MSINFSAGDASSATKMGSSNPNSDGNIGSASGSFISNSNSMFQSMNTKNMGGEGEGEKKVNLWYTLLKNVAKREETKVAHILVLGDRGVGKRSLIKALNKPFLKLLGIQLTVFDEIGSDFSLFESSYLYMKDIGEYEEGNQNIGIDESTLLYVNVWIINDQEMGHMIPKIIKPEELQYTMAIVMPEMEHPWDLMDDCKKWIDVLKDGIFQLTPKLELKQMQMLRERNEILFKTYEEPELDEEGRLKNKRKKITMKQSDHGDSFAQNDSRLDEIDISIMEEQEMVEDVYKEMELPEGALVTNLFIPVMVVCSKVDLIQHGDKTLKEILVNNLDYIQYSLRKFCLSYGAALIFASTKTSGQNQAKSNLQANI